MLPFIKRIIMESKEKPSEETLNQWHADPDNWKFGIFYFNRKDKRIFPPKKIRALGWTVNFANPISVLSIVLIVILVYVLSRWLDFTKR
jgi:uncharacterized membrane protein